MVTEVFMGVLASECRWACVEIDGSFRIIQLVSRKISETEEVL